MIQSDELRTLVDLGFLAATRGWADEARPIFDAVRAVRPHEPAGFVGLALLALNDGRPADAVKLLRQAAPADSVRAFLGAALLQLGETEEARSVLQDVIDTASDPAPKDLARVLLQGLAQQDALPLPR